MSARCLWSAMRLGLSGDITSSPIACLRLSLVTNLAGQHPAAPRHAGQGCSGVAKLQHVCPCSCLAGMCHNLLRGQKLSVVCCSARLGWGRVGAGPTWSTHSHHAEHVTAEWLLLPKQQIA